MIASACTMSSLIVFFSFLFVSPFVDSLYFNFPEFKQGDPNMVYQGDAIPNGFVEFNDINYMSRIGWATYAGKVPIWDPSTGKASDFSTNFSFMISTPNRTYFGDGFTFFLAPVGVQMVPNTAGGLLGLFNIRNGNSSSLFPVVHIEFDTHNNHAWDPRDVDAHVGINNNSLVSSSYTAWNASSHHKDIGHVRIKYDSATKNLSVSWSYEVTSNPRENSSLFCIIDLAKVLPPLVTVGFSAVTGNYAERHRLFSWEFSSNLDINDMKDSTNQTRMGVGVSVSGLVMMAFVIVMIMVMRRQKQRKKETRETTNSRPSINEDLARGTTSRRFAYKVLASATNNFSDERKMGEGGFGAVYKGYLNNLDMMVAVKKFAGGSTQGKKEFITEVKIVSSLRHRNLVQLIGWCYEKDELLLVYELMPNGSLDSHIFGRTHLEWAIRYKISLGLASALFYLHEEWEQCVVHRDIKASNILLDSNFNVKLGDFGLARLMDHELGTWTTGLAGTFGYMAPEYISTGRASKESDVYSFGIVLLELVTGRRSVEPRQGRTKPEKSLVEKVWDLYGRRELVSAIDEKLGINFDGQQAERVMVVGLWCAHPDSNSRPSIRQAIQVLNFEAGLPVLPPRMPVPTYLVSLSFASVSSAGGSVTFSSAQVGR